MTKDSNTASWEACPQGTLTGLSTELKHQRRRAELMRAAGAVSALLILVAVGWFAMRSSNDRHEFHFGDITCSEVHQAMPAFLSGDIDQAVVEKIDIHLAACPQCQKYMEEMRSANEHARTETVKPQMPTLVAGRF